MALQETDNLWLPGNSDWAGKTDYHNSGFVPGRVGIWHGIGYRLRKGIRWDSYVRAAVGRGAVVNDQPLR